MRHLFIINPAAGRPESTARLETLLSRLSFPHEVAYTREQKRQKMADMWNAGCIWEMRNISLLWNFATGMLFHC